MQKSFYGTIILASCLAISSAAFAANTSEATTTPSNNIQLNCGSSVITLGQTQAQIIKSCGDASYTRSSKKSNSISLFYKQLDKNPAVENKTKFKFVNDKLVEVSYEVENKKFDD